MNESFGIRIASDPVARLWSGVGDLPVPSDIVEGSPAIYLGGGALISAADFQQVINGSAERIEIKVSGVSAVTLQLALDEAAGVKGAKVHFVRFDFDEEWQLIDVVYEAVFRADKLSVESRDGEGRERAITLSMGSEDTGRSRAPLAYFTPQDQSRRSSDDVIFDHVPGLTAGTSRRFGTR